MVAKANPGRKYPGAAVVPDTGCEDGVAGDPAGVQVSGY